MRIREIITEAIDTEPIFQMATERLTAIACISMGS